jgi:hypothetical protein
MQYVQADAIYRSVCNMQQETRLAQNFTRDVGLFQVGTTGEMHFGKAI